MLRVLLVLACVLFVQDFAEAKSQYVINVQGCTFNGDGSASTCAASDGAAGAYRGMANVLWGAGAGKVSDGDTLYLCGFHDGGQDLAVAESNLTPTTNAIIDGACPGNTGSWISANHRYTSGWTGPDAFGAYSRASGGCSNMHMAQLVNGVPTRLPYPKTGVPDATWAAGSFYDDCAGNKYVRPIGDVSANSTTIYTTWTGAITLTNVAVTVQHLTLYGLSSDYCIQLSNADNSIIQDNTIKWCSDYAIPLRLASDGAIIRRNDISESGNAVYVIATTTATNSNSLSITDNTIHDLNQDGYYTSSATHDGHAIGMQGGTSNVLSGNTMTNLGGTCITAYDYAGQVLKLTRITGNWCQGVHETTTLGRGEKGIEYSNINTGHVANDVADNLVAGNVIIDVGAACIDTKSVQPTVGQPWQYINNTLASCGKGLYMRDDTDGNTGFVFKNNICSNCTINVDHFQNGTDTLTGIVMDYNRWYPDGATSFEWNGTKSAFATWQTNSSQDAHSAVTDPGLAPTYRLLGSSTARHAGIANASCLDYGGGACSIPPDLGAFQVAPTARTARTRRR